MIDPNAPYLHDRWEDQLALEQEMSELGRQRVLQRINRAIEKRDMTRLRPHRSLVKEFIPTVSAELTRWLDERTKKRGPKPIALPFLKLVPANTCAMVALKCILRMIGIDRRTVLSVALEIGTWIEHEARCLAWMESEEEKDSWKAIDAYYRRRGSNAAHKRRARIVIFNKYVADKIGWQDWTQEQRNRVGLELIDIVVRSTKRFRVVPKPMASAADKPKNKKHRMPLVIEAEEDLMNWIRGSLDDEELFAPYFLPTVMPPKPWDGPRDGGYWTPFVKTPFMIRFKASHEDQRQRAIDDYESIDMPDVYDALNWLQETPWRINKQVYWVFKTLWERGSQIAGLPRQEEIPVPPRPEGEKDDEHVKAWTEMAGKIRTANSKTSSHVVEAKTCMTVATRFLDEERFYYPHMLDFRGRVYPIPATLQPQGGDLARGLLEFADGKPIGEEGWKWLAIHLANQFGVDKVSFDERIAWAAEREDLWEKIADSPLTHTEWADADEPFQALAAIFEYVAVMREGLDYVSHAVVRVDGSCNGLQHLSAMVRDEVGGAAVNLVPMDEPQDIYGQAAQDLHEIVKRDAKGAEYAAPAKSWLSIFGEKAPRSITKRPVMILPYGGTREAYMKYTMKWLDEHDPDYRHIDKEERYKYVGYVVKTMWAAVSKKLLKARLVMMWLQDCAKEASKTGKPLYWKTPAGFVVRHFYGQEKRINVETKIDGQIISLSAQQVQKTLDKQAQATGIAPNFVHSMDASNLMTAALYARDSGITCLSTIHDSYGTHASDMWTLFDSVRKAFVDTYEHDVLQEFEDACRDVLRGDFQAPDNKPENGTLDLNQVTESMYFFA